MTLSLITFASIAQVQFKLTEPIIGSNYSFSIANKSEIILPQNVVEHRVVHILSDSTLIISYFIAVRSDSLLKGLTFNVKDSIIHDSIELVKLKKLLPIQQYRQNRYELVNSIDINYRFPIEDIKNERQNLSIKNSIYIDTLFSKTKGIQSDNLIKVNGEVQVVAQAAENSYRNQQNNPNFIRGFLNLNVEVAGIPFQVGSILTTEHGVGENPLSNYRLSFNSAKFMNEIKSKIDKRAAIRQQDILEKRIGKPGLSIQEIDAEYNLLSKQLKSEKYIKSLAINEQIISRGTIDTSFKQSYKYRKAIELRQEAKLKEEKLKQLDSLRIVISKIRQEISLEKDFIDLAQNNKRTIRKNAFKMGVVSKPERFLLDVNKFDIGTFSPNYTQLVLSGISLSGINLEFNPTPIYIALTYGISPPSSFTYQRDMNNRSVNLRNIYAGRLGFGDQSRFLVAFSYLYGNGKNDSNLIERTNSYESMNAVVGVDLSYKLTKNLEVSMEYARSENRRENNSENQQNVRNELFDFKNLQYSSAYFTRIAYNIEKPNNSKRVSVLIQKIDPFYFSFGTPYLRQDNLRAEMKGEYLWYKRQLGISSTYRRDEDNLYNLKQGNSINQSALFSIQVKLRGKPYLILTYCPSLQYFYNTEAGKRVSSHSILLSAIVGYKISKKKYNLNSQLLFSSQNTSSKNFNGSVNDIKQLTINEYLILPQKRVSIIGVLTTSVANHKIDSSLVISSSLKLTRGFRKVALSLGVRYLEDRQLEERLVFETEYRFNLNHGITVSANLEYHQISSYITIGSKDTMYTGRLTIIKSF